MIYKKKFAMFKLGAGAGAKKLENGRLPQSLNYLILA